MAILSPSMVPSLRADAGRFRELEVLERLRDHLPAQFEVFHSIALHSVNGMRDHYGEIDVAVLAPDGCLLLIEVKAGPVLLRDGEIFKVYSDAECDVSRQGRMQRAAMQNRLQEAGLKTTLLSCLVLPDYDLGDNQIISIPRERIIDATRYDAMCSIVQQWLGVAHSEVDHTALRRLLRNQFRVTPHRNVLRNQLQGTVRQLSDGLATWVPRIESPSGVYRIEATAGSGKTQLALQLLEAAAADRANASYVCFNRSLADHVRRIAPTRAEVVNYHELCVEHHRRDHAAPRPLDHRRGAGLRPGLGRKPVQPTQARRQAVPSHGRPSAAVSASPRRTGRQGKPAPGTAVPGLREWRKDRKLGAPAGRPGRPTAAVRPRSRLHADVEQAALSPSNIVPGMGYSPDKMLQARLFAYHDAQLYRVGTNHQHLPVNRPRCPFHNQQRDGAMAIANGGAAANYDPVRAGGPVAGGFGHGDAGWKLEGTAGRYDTRATDDHYTQAGNLFRMLTEEGKRNLIDNIAGALSQADATTRDRQVGHFLKADPAYGKGVAQAIERILPRA